MTPITGQASLAFQPVVRTGNRTDDKTVMIVALFVVPLPTAVNSTKLACYPTDNFFPNDKDSDSVRKSSPFEGRLHA
jgi:hypothetical protein